MRATWLWPAVIICSICAADLCAFVIPGTGISELVVLWFLFVCPGMTVVRFFQLDNALAEWTLAIALSLSLDAIVAGLLLYAHLWSPGVILLILVNSSLVGVIAQLLREVIWEARALKEGEGR